MLELRNLTIRYGGHAALAGLDLDVADGEVLAVMGPSGCGKTTLLRAIAGLVTPDDGSIAWNGTSLSSTPAYQRGFGLMFQDYALFPHRSVAGNVAFGLQMAGLDQSAVNARVGVSLEKVGLAGYGDRTIGSLSGGEQQRVALARTLAPAPHLVMLDEPIGSLDRALRDGLMTEMRELFAELALTVVYVTHDQSEAFAIADRIAVMRSGTIERIGTPEELWHDPQTEFVARFIGLETIATATVTNGRMRFDWGSFPSPAPPGSYRVALPPEAFTVDSASEIRARVRTAAYRGGNYQIRARIAEDNIVLMSSTKLAPGAEIGVGIDPSRFIPLTG